MGDINRRPFLLIFLLIALVGTTGILFYSITNYRDGETSKTQPSSKTRPSYVLSIGSKNNHRLRAPLNVATTDNLLYVADSDNGLLSIFSQTGTFKSSINPAPGAQNVYPLGVAVDQKQRVYLTLTVGSENKIMVFNAKGSFLYEFPKSANGTSTLPPGKPMAVFSANNRLYVTDILDHDIKVYNLDGELVTRFGRPGSAKGEFSYPNGIVADTAGYIYVSDSNNGRVQVFDEKGEFSHLFIVPKKNPLALPRGIAIDKLGWVHVVDTLRHQVFVFTKQGKFLFTYGKFGTRKDTLSYPNGVAIDSKTGAIFIADKMNNRVSVWK
ncbi:MAG: SMP-30/gluconolactonase/LRE family protein [Actinobacteria bacterium]|nr:SMP-30/gluconolactonase/LRE family protein [Actinomycetota bacterium]